jgi:hypothetical protein
LARGWPWPCPLRWRRRSCKRTQDADARERSLPVRKVRSGRVQEADVGGRVALHSETALRPNVRGEAADGVGLAREAHHVPRRSRAKCKAVAPRLDRGVGSRFAAPKETVHLLACLTRSFFRCRAGRAQAQDAVARRHHAPGHEPVGVGAAACGAGAAAAPHPVPRRTGTERPSCGRWWCRRRRRHMRKRPPNLRPRPSAKSRLSSPGRTISAQRGCSSGSSTSTCSTARTAAAGSSRSSQPSWRGRRAGGAEQHRRPRAVRADVFPQFGPAEPRPFSQVRRRLRPRAPLR